MPNNDQTSLLAVAGVGHQWTNLWFAPNGASNPVSFGGAYVDSVVRTGVGTYLVTLSGFAPRALLAAFCHVFDAAEPTNSRGRVREPTISGKTITFTTFTSRALGGVGNKDIAAGADNLARIELHWKVYPGEDVSGL